MEEFEKKEKINNGTRKKAERKNKEKLMQK